MSFSRLCSLSMAVLCLCVLQWTAPLRSYADTYQLFNLGGDSELTFHGISNTGVVVFSQNSCSTNCYVSYYDGLVNSTSSSLPSFTDDRGSSCTPSLPSGWGVQFGRCNGSYAAFTGEFGASPPEGVFTVENGIPTKLPYLQLQMGGSALWINSIGDIVFDDGFQDNWWIAVNQNTLPTPEPSALLLLATGIAGGGLLLARRRAII